MASQTFSEAASSDALLVIKFKKRSPIIHTSFLYDVTHYT
ncbi:MAG: hypothetical protein ACI8UC_000533, partial [Psychromonas sp.]